MSLDDTISISTLLLALSAAQCSIEDLYSEWTYPVGLFLRVPRRDGLRNGAARLTMVVRSTAAVGVLWQFAGKYNSNVLTSLFVVILAVSSIVLRPLMPGSVESAFQVLFSSQLAILYLAPRPIRPLILLLIGFTACLGYCVSGLGKIVNWRDNRNLPAMLRLPYLGNCAAADFFDSHPTVTAVAESCVKLWEASFPLSVVCGPKVCGFFLFTGVLFHVANSVMMGFTRAPLAIIVSYPALYFSSVALHSVSS